MTKQRWHPHVTVATIIKQDDKYLMVEEHCQQNGSVINQPAGHIDAGESIVDAAIRETLEETCWLVAIDYLVGIYQWSIPQPNPEAKTYLRFTFSGRTIQNQNDQVTRDVDIINTHWLTSSEIKNDFVVRSPLVMQSILDYEANKQFPLNAYLNLDP